MSFAANRVSGTLGCTDFDIHPSVLRGGNDGNWQLQLRKKVRASFASMISHSAPAKRMLLRRFRPPSGAPAHPFDIAYGTQTAGLIPSFLLSKKYSKTFNRKLYPYFGCQPNCVRAAIEFIGLTNDYDFYDLGCGMGRAVIVAREYQFRSIIGVEISPELCEIANENINIVSQKCPGKTPIYIQNSDAESLDFKEHNIVVFLYNPFGPEIMKNVLTKLLSIIKMGWKVVIVYENPVYFDVIDEFPELFRQYGVQIACSDDERLHHLDDDEAVAVWSSFEMADSNSRSFSFRTTKPGWRVEVADI